jgi:6-pyruvoyltetrahydropterin/6-carboxytetrahydropterin synthase
MAEFDVLVSKEDFKFGCAHFIAHGSYREKLHGHNYRMTVKLTGTDCINNDGYLVDFGDVKRAARDLCKSINETFLCPMKSDCLTITEEGAQLCLQCADGSRFSFPKADCAQLPIVHSSAEEIAHWMWCSMVR